MFRPRFRYRGNGSRKYQMQLGPETGGLLRIIISLWKNTTILFDEIIEDETIDHRKNMRNIHIDLIPDFRLTPPGHDGIDMYSRWLISALNTTASEFSYRILINEEDRPFLPELGDNFKVIGDQGLEKVVISAMKHRFLKA